MKLDHDRVRAALVELCAAFGMQLLPPAEPAGKASKCKQCRDGRASICADCMQKAADQVQRLTQANVRLRGGSLGAPLAEDDEPSPIPEYEHEPRPTAVAAVRRPLNLALAEMGPAGSKILTALAQHGYAAKTKLLTLTGYRDTGSFNSTLAALRRDGFVDDLDGEIGITSTGRLALGTWSPLPTGHALAGYWMDRLPATECKILEAFLQQRGRAIGKARLLEITEYRDTGSFNSALATLRRLDLLVKDRDGERAVEELFG